MVYFNCHTHIFNQQCAPDKLVDARLGRFKAFFIKRLANFDATRQLLAWFVRLQFAPDSLRRPLSFLAIGASELQDTVFRKLLEAYPDWPEARFVVLTLNMEHMGAGRCEVDFATQLEQVATIKKHFPSQCLPFVAVDPRMNTQRFGCKNLTEFVEKFLDRGFVGIKLYPSMGYWPFDERLVEEVYPLAVKWGIPVLTHCDRGGVFLVRKANTVVHPPDASNRPWLANLNFKQPDADFADYFLDPRNYVEVLEQFKELKLCFAHFGGGDVLKSHQNQSDFTANWYEEIKKLLHNPKFPNVYADISYTLHDNQALRKIAEDSMPGKPGGWSNRVLFGTDYYMTEMEMAEAALNQQYRTLIVEDVFTAWTTNNPKRFLASNRYNP